MPNFLKKPSHSNMASIPLERDGFNNALIEENLREVSKKVRAKTRRILCIDGGGVKGMFSAAFLHEINNQVDGHVADYFDLISGTSAGGIIALGLGLRVEPSNIMKFYEKESLEIFNKSLLRKFISLSPIYNKEKLKTVLKEIFNQKKIGDSKNRLLIPAWNETDQRPRAFKTAHHKNFIEDYKKSAIDIALATSAAPLYFEKHITPDGKIYLDGGLFANNPITFSVVEALSFLEWNKNDLKVLSIGTNNFHFNTVWEKKNIPLLASQFYIEDLIKKFIATQESTSINMAKLLINNDKNENIIRVSCPFDKEQPELDDIKKIPELKEKGLKAAQENFSSLKDLFFKNPAEPFIPEQSTGD